MALSWAERVQASVSRSRDSVPRSTVSEDTVGGSCSSTPPLSPSWEVIRREDVTDRCATVLVQASSMDVELSSVVVVEAGDGADEELPPTPREEEDSVAAGSWACPACTYTNTPEHEACDMCGTPAPPLQDALPEPISPRGEESSEVPAMLEGELVVVDTRATSWYQEAKRDLENYMARLREEEGEEEDEEWAPRAVTARKKFEGEAYVKVQWRSHPEATWELEEAFIDQGHQPLIDEFCGARKKEKPIRPPREPRERHDLDFGSRFWPGFQERIGELFRNCGLTLTGIEQLPLSGYLRDFARRVESGEGMPVMLTHGTQPQNIDRIVRSGLVVPTANGPVRVLNGSAYGVGIYTARNPALSVGYARGCGHMFVCAGMIKGDEVVGVKQVNDTVVFFNAADVVPCFLVSYKLGRGDAVPVRVRPYNKTGSRRAPPVVRAAAPQIFTAAPPPRSVRSGLRTGEQGGPQKHQAWDSNAPKLTKKTMRSQPRAVKEAYKRGLLTQKAGAK